MIDGECRSLEHPVVGCVDYVPGEAIDEKFEQFRNEIAEAQLYMRRKNACLYLLCAKPWKRNLILKWNWITGLSIYEDIPDSVRADRQRRKRIEWLKEKINPIYIKLFAKIANVPEEDIRIEFNEFGFIDPIIYSDKESLYKSGYDLDKEEGDEDVM
jgi:hypothetical protein